MRPLSAFNASASALGNVHANWTVRSIGPASFPTVSTDGFFLWHTQPENGMKTGTRIPPDHLVWKRQRLAAGYDSVNYPALASDQSYSLDSGGQWQITTTPTPGGGNRITGGSSTP